MVNKDWSTKCAWYKRHKQKALEDKQQKFDRKMRLKIEKCQGPECSYVTGYRDRIIKEEFGEKDR
jgi:UDP-2,3-diacylglucosamine pyrophosphatase LpxH